MIVRHSFGASVAAVIPAAGRSRRFGSDKRKALVNGVPMLEKTVQLMKSAGIDRVIVVDQNPDVDRGMFSTIQIGLAQAQPADIVLVQPADMPFVSIETVHAVIRACSETSRAVCPRFQGKRGHPLALPSGVAAALLAVDPRTPLNEALAGIGAVRHELDVADPGILRDVDVPGDLNG